MDPGYYLADPCRASSLPFWKAERLPIPERLAIVRDDAFSPVQYGGRDDPYFKLRHDLKAVRATRLPDGYELVRCGVPDFAAHIAACYPSERVSPEELEGYRSHPVHAPDLWLAAAETGSGRIVATGIAELDTRIGEGVLEWIQVSPDHRRKGLGTFLVCSLLQRMRGRADFATVSGRMDSESRPLALYTACGFTDPVVWHVVTR